MDERSEKTLGIALMFFGISMWEILPSRGFTFTSTLLIHMSFVIPGVYLFERPFIRYMVHKLKGRKKD